MRAPNLAIRGAGALPRDLGLDVHAVHRDALTVSFMNLVERRDGRAAGPAPARPEVEQHDLAGRGKRDAIPFGGSVARRERQIDRRSLLSDERGGRSMRLIGAEAEELATGSQHHHDRDGEQTAEDPERPALPGLAHADPPATGSRMRNAAPPSGAAPQSIEPPCSKTTFFTIANPSPVPSPLVV